MQSLAPICGEPSQAELQVIYTARVRAKNPLDLH
jgi:hypothetical protein